jgi:hypothetical protein
VVQRRIGCAHPLACRLADTVPDRLARRTGEPPNAFNTTAVDLHLHPAHPGRPWHPLDRASDPRVWSVHGSRDIRWIVPKTAASLFLGDVGQPDEADRGAEHRTREPHPKTGAAPLVEGRETGQDLMVPPDMTDAQPAPSIGARSRFDDAAQCPAERRGRADKG